MEREVEMACSVSTNLVTEMMTEERQLFYIVLDCFRKTIIIMLKKKRREELGLGLAQAILHFKNKKKL